MVDSESIKEKDVVDREGGKEEITKKEEIEKIDTKKDTDIKDTDTKDTDTKKDGIKPEDNTKENVTEDDPNKTITNHSLPAKPLISSPPPSSTTSSPTKIPLITPENDKDISYAPSFKEVNSNNDELAELRGEGRYFGVADPEASEPICSNCHQRGHKRAHCPVVVCHLCGAVGDHYEAQCPVSMVCTNCGEKGHYRNQCPKRRRFNYCTYCRSRAHATERCPNIWRSYIMHSKKLPAKQKYPANLIYCYNCGEKGHFGDDCPYPRVSRTPNINGSAFTGQNLPREFRDEYLNRMSERNRNFEQFDEDDMYSEDEPRRNENGRKRRRRGDLGPQSRKRRRQNSSRQKSARYPHSYHNHNSRHQPSKSGFLPSKRVKPLRTGYLHR